MSANVLLCVTGSVAAIKVNQMVHSLQTCPTLKANVRVVMSKTAAHFVKFFDWPHLGCPWGNKDLESRLREDEEYLAQGEEIPFASSASRIQTDSSVPALESSSVRPTVASPYRLGNECRQQRQSTVEASNLGHANRSILELKSEEDGETGTAAAAAVAMNSASVRHRSFEELYNEYLCSRQIALPQDGGETTSTQNSTANSPLITDDHAYEFFANPNPDGSFVIVYTDTHEWGSWNRLGDPVLHIDLRSWADVLVLAPLTANTLAKIANGQCDTLITCVVRAWDMGVASHGRLSASLRKGIVAAPAMNTMMWDHPLTGRHFKELYELHNTEERKGYGAPPALLLAVPQSKRLACGDVGRGAMATPATITELTAQIYTCRENAVLLTGGGGGNESSGWEVGGTNTFDSGSIFVQSSQRHLSFGSSNESASPTPTSSFGAITGSSARGEAAASLFRVAQSSWICNYNNFVMLWPRLFWSGHPQHPLASGPAFHMSLPPPPPPPSSQPQPPQNGHMNVSAGTTMGNNTNTSGSWPSQQYQQYAGSGCSLRGASDARHALETSRSSFRGRVDNDDDNVSLRRPTTRHPYAASSRRAVPRDDGDSQSTSEKSLILTLTADPSQGPPVSGGTTAGVAIGMSARPPLAEGEANRNEKSSAAKAPPRRQRTKVTLSPKVSQTEREGEHQDQQKRRCVPPQPAPNDYLYRYALNAQSSTSHVSEANVLACTSVSSSTQSQKSSGRTRRRTLRNVNVVFREDDTTDNAPQQASASSEVTRSKDGLQTVVNVDELDNRGDADSSREEDKNDDEDEDAFMPDPFVEAFADPMPSPKDSDRIVIDDQRVPVSTTVHASGRNQRRRNNSKRKEVSSGIPVSSLWSAHAEPPAINKQNRRRRNPNSDQGTTHAASAADSPQHDTSKQGAEAAGAGMNPRTSARISFEDDAPSLLGSIPTRRRNSGTDFNERAVRLSTDHPMAMALSIHTERGGKGVGRDESAAAASADPSGDGVRVGLVGSTFSSRSSGVLASVLRGDSGAYVRVDTKEALDESTVSPTSAMGAAHEPHVSPSFPHGIGTNTANYSATTSSATFKSNTFLLPPPFTLTSYSSLGHKNEVFAASASSTLLGAFTIDPTDPLPTHPPLAKASRKRRGGGTKKTIGQKSDRREDNDKEEEEDNIVGRGRALTTDERTMDNTACANPNRLVLPSPRPLYEAAFLVPQHTALAPTSTEPTIMSQQEGCDATQQSSASAHEGRKTRRPRMKEYERLVESSCGAIEFSRTHLLAENTEMDNTQIFATYARLRKGDSVRVIVEDKKTGERHTGKGVVEWTPLYGGRAMVQYSVLDGRTLPELESYSLPPDHHYLISIRVV